MGSTCAIETTLAAAVLQLCPRNGAHALVRPALRVVGSFSTLLWSRRNRKTLTALGPWSLGRSLLSPHKDSLLSIPAVELEV